MKNRVGTNGEETPFALYRLKEHLGHIKTSQGPMRKQIDSFTK